ncbi:WXG100 family type VII secretion target [Dactylosporangium aurantiacum]|jgi:early secretory antigenic target protein ESAT-6|uniref:ESAT-6-like protein n=2 Tax=Dactylosporangium aurantiacum TaxID=35754 RepID=A0A9Q9MFI0_9ACTN|nr:WXG100 family type VII secretion target [Dactylosporangium aurantiacum]MDG6108551.1 WXG100 family type VII secretion target [Dactylosporangium aurantiacum]UWZ57218.1 WXG100 family type VII secretion target [Dactylosporangium aurantiacum]
MSYFQTNYAQMETASQTIQGIAKTIDTELDTLRMKLQNMTWDGKDREAYNQHQAKWDAAVKDINALLNEIGGAVGIARANYITTEMNNAQVW